MTTTTANRTTPTASTTPTTASGAAPATGHTALNWFEIPVSDMDRAQRFYEAVLDKPLQRQAMGPQTLAVLPYTAPGVGGALLAGPGAPAPGTGGTMVYLNVNPRLDDAVARATAAGAQLVQPRLDLPEGMGAFAHLIDSEGNRVGLHALA